MKAREKGGVVDANLNVYGTQNLKVAGNAFRNTLLIEDMSICPSNLGGNTYSTALVIGEKAAVIVGKELGLKV